VQTIAASIEELGESITEISEQLSASSAMDAAETRDAEKLNPGHVSPIQRHRDSVATGLAQSGRRDLHDPKDKSDFRHLACRILRSGHIASRCRMSLSAENFGRVGV
jgi:hypothetical protein